MLLVFHSLAATAYVIEDKSSPTSGGIKHYNVTEHNQSLEEARERCYQAVAALTGLPNGCVLRNGTTYSAGYIKSALPGRLHPEHIDFYLFGFTIKACPDGRIPHRDTGVCICACGQLEQDGICLPDPGDWVFEYRRNTWYKGKGSSTEQCKQQQREHLCHNNPVNPVTINNPVNCATGQKRQQEWLYRGTGRDPLTVALYYQSPGAVDLWCSVLAEVLGFAGKAERM